MYVKGRRNQLCFKYNKTIFNVKNTLQEKIFIMFNKSLRTIVCYRVLML